MEISHFLKFYHTKSSKKPFIFSSYDEIILKNVPEEIYQRYLNEINSQRKTMIPENIVDDDYLKLRRAINTADIID